jgi:hypothetical protein
VGVLDFARDDLHRDAEASQPAQRLGQVGRSEGWLDTPPAETGVMGVLDCVRRAVLLTTCG